MNYHVVFDLHQAGFKAENVAPLALGVFFVAIGFVFVLFRHRLIHANRLARSMPFFFLFFAVFWTVSALAVFFGSYTKAIELMDSGRVSVAEGIVRQFHPMSATGHAMEHFCVNDACFTYADYVATPGFNQTSTNGGPIHEGAPVRVTYSGNVILRLEIADKKEP